jgi:hypothetical protein
LGSNAAVGKYVPAATHISSSSSVKSAASRALWSSGNALDHCVPLPGGDAALSTNQRLAGCASALGAHAPANPMQMRQLLMRAIET